MNLWKGPEETLAGGAFGSNGCWNVAGKKWGARDIPTIGDMAILPAGDYTVTLDEATWSLGALSVGAGAKLRLPALPCGAFDASIISWLQSPSAVILEAKKIKSVTISLFTLSICHEVMGLDAMILVF